MVRTFQTVPDEPLHVKPLECDDTHLACLLAAARFRGLETPDSPPDLFEVYLWNITNVAGVRKGAKPRLVRLACSLHVQSTSTNCSIMQSIYQNKGALACSKGMQPRA